MVVAHQSADSSRAIDNGEKPHECILPRTADCHDTRRTPSYGSPG